MLLSYLSMVILADWSHCREWDKILESPFSFANDDKLNKGEDYAPKLKFKY